ESTAAKPSKTKNTGSSPLLKNNMTAATLFFLLGVITIGMEILWVRALMQYFPNNRYVFSTVTVALLTALFLGSVSNRFFKADKRNILYACLTLAASAQLCLGLQEYFNFFKHFAELDSLVLFSMKTALVMMLVAGMPGFIMGLLFPMLFNYSLNRKAADNARLTFLSVTANSAGAICGALLFGMILMSVAGYNILFTSANLLILLVTVVLLLKHKTGKGIVICLAVLAVFAASAYPLFRDVPYENYYRLAKINGADANIEIFAEKDFDNPNRILVLDRAYISGGSGYIAERRQKKQGFLPVLLAPRKDSALVISLATGITASAFADAGVFDIDCVELLPTAVTQASYFQRQNSNILSDRSFNLFIDDGRSFIKNSKRKYDIILSDNYQYGCASTPVMYSLETFSDIRKIMSDNGVFIQWLPLRQIPPKHLAIIINTFRQVFPDGKLYFEDITRDSAFLGLLAYKDGGISYQQAAQNYLEIKSAASKSLFNHDIACVYYIGTVAEYSRMFPAAEINTYEHPALEKYFSGKDFNNHNMNNLLALYRQSKPDVLVPFNNALADSTRRNIFTGLEPVLNLKKDKQYASALQGLDNLIQNSNLNNQNINTFFPEVSFLKGELATALAVQSLTQGDLTGADENFKIAESTIFRNSLFYRFNGILAGLKGDIIAAQVAFGRALQEQPENLWVYESMALTYLHYGNREKALESMQKAMSMPYPDKAILRTALNIYMRLDSYNDFLPVLEEYLTLPAPDKRILAYCADYLKSKGNSTMIQKVEKMLNNK
ncbi:MAG: spermine/spermidine synthase domain-containing protein, partial [Victivallaceae bacterium]